MKRKLVFLLALALIFSLTACGNSSGSATNQPSQPPAVTSATPTMSSAPESSPESTPEPTVPSGEPEYGGVLRIVGNSTIEPFGVPWLNQTMNRPFAPWGEPLLMETTYGEIKPYLAASWEVDVDNLEIVLQLRDDVKFSDGSDFNAEVVVWNIEKWKEGGMLNPAIKGAELRGDYEVAVLLNDYTNSILGILATRANCFISKESYEKNGEDWAMNNPVGTGPFVLKERVPGYHVSFERNENYWNPGLPYLDGVIYVELTDELAQNAALLSTSSEDYIDIVQSTSTTQITTMAAEGTGVTLRQSPLGAMCLMPSSMEEGTPLSKVEVRQAVAYAIDRESICEAFGMDFYTPAVQLYSEPFPGVLPDSYNCKYDPDKAKELLEAAGYPDGIDITFYAPQGTDRDAMTAIADMLSSVGIRCDMQFPESGTAADLRSQGWSNGLFATSVRAFSNITTTFRMYFDPGYQYYPCVWRPDEMGPIFNEARSTIDVEEDLCAEIHKMIMDNMLTIPVYTTQDNWLIKDNVHDSGFGEWSAGTQSRLDLAWKSTK